MPNPFLLAGLGVGAVVLAVVLLHRRRGERAPHAPPAADAVALRALAIAAGCARAHLEAAATREKKLPLDEAERHRAALAAWLESHGLLPHLSRAERAWVETPAGRLSEDALLDASWTAEGLAVLLWALGRVGELPPDGVEAEPGALLQAVPPVGSDPAKFAQGASLRPREEIEAAAFHAYERYDLECRDEFGAAVASRGLSIALERRRAFRWLSGDSAKF
jgi:hypothetical protein